MTKQLAIGPSAILWCIDFAFNQNENVNISLIMNNFFSALFLCEIVSISFGIVVKMYSYIFQCWFRTFYTEYCNKDYITCLVIEFDFNAADFVVIFPTSFLSS